MKAKKNFKMPVYNPLVKLVKTRSGAGSHRKSNKACRRLEKMSKLDF